MAGDDTAYVDLARAIRDYATEPSVELDEFARVIDQWPAQARAEAVTAAFAGLPARERWEILARLFDDDELRRVLAADHEREAAEAVRATRRQALLDLVADHHCLDTRWLHSGEIVAIGLFREVDVHAALALGEASSSCARRLVLRAIDEDGSLVVVEDVFNPRHGLFVTPDYDEDAWRAERLAANTRVRVGAAVEGAPSFEPVVWPAARVDVETAGRAHQGRLHAGYVTVDGAALFTGVRS